MFIMVKFEVWQNEKFQCIRRSNLKIKDAKDALITIQSIGITDVTIFNRWTENKVMVKTIGDCNYTFKFTNKQMDSLKELFIELNNGIEPEMKWI